MYLNRVSLIGFTGQQPKTLATRTGKEITRLSVATTRRYQQDSEWKEKTQWHDCVLYGALAQSAATIAIGTHILIEGELTYREFERTMEADTGAFKVQWPVTEIGCRFLPRARSQIQRNFRTGESRLAAPTFPYRRSRT